MFDAGEVDLRSFMAGADVLEFVWSASMTAIGVRLGEPLIMLAVWLMMRLLIQSIWSIHFNREIQQCLIALMQMMCNEPSLSGCICVVRGVWKWQQRLATVKKEMKM
jgi:hypothetical protein